MLKKLLASLALLLASHVHAAVVVNFTAQSFQFVPGPFTHPQTITGSFEIDENGNFGTFNNGALDNLSISVIDPLGGLSTFGATDATYRQFTSAGGTDGFIAGGSGGGSLFGNFFDGTDTWAFTGFSFDWRGLAADLFPNADPSNVANGMGRSDDGNPGNDEITYALMSLNFDLLGGGASSDALRISFSSITFSSLASPGAGVPSPAPLALLLATLPILLRRQRR